MNDSTLAIRYIGADQARRFVIQRGDFAFWTGDDFDVNIDAAKVYYDHKTAQKACAALQYQQYKGKPVRTFTLEVTVTLAADEVQAIPLSALVAWLGAAVRIDIENTVFGDGPVKDSFVRARMYMKSIKETKSRRKRF